MSDLLGNYAIEEMNTGYQLSFEIPDNCNYTTSLTNQINFVTISLNSGEKDPSPNTASYVISYSATSILMIQFEQQDLTETENVVYAKKPKIIINDNPISY